MRRMQLSIIIVVAMMAIACGPSKSGRNRIVKQYQRESEFYKVTLKLSSMTTSLEAYVVAEDKYEATRLLDATYTNDIVTIISMDEIRFIATQRYPYGN